MKNVHSVAQIQWNSSTITPIVRGLTWIAVNHIATPVRAAQHEADQHQHLEVPVDEPRREPSPAATPQPLEVTQEHPAADGHLGQEDVEDPQAADRHPLHHRTVVLDGIVFDIHDAFMSEDSGFEIPDFRARLGCPVMDTAK